MRSPHRLDGRWTWCPACKIPRIRCLDPECFGISCNGGGCLKCSADFDEQIARRNPAVYGGLAAP